MDHWLGGDGFGSQAGDWAGACAGLNGLPARPAGTPRARRVIAWLARVREYLEQSFVVHEIGTGTMTGYYEPTLRGDLSRSEAFAVPLHAMPSRDWARPRMAPAPTELAEFAADAEVLLPANGGDADPSAHGDGSNTRPPETAAVPERPPRVASRTRSAAVPRPRPYPSRAEIDSGALDGQGLELVWVDNAVDAFFLHIQGSGRVVLPDGRLLRVGYAGQNGHPYLAIGRMLIERGQVRREAMSMQAIRAWLAQAGSPTAQSVLQANASYVFFRLVEGLSPDEGPIGAMGVPLTPMRSVAVDPAFVPMGAPVYLAGSEPLPRLLVAQDVGGAIRGAGRADLFWGWDEDAGVRAGRTYQPGRMFLLRPRQP